jgi:hypothetical protein
VIQGYWRSITYDGDMAEAESLIGANGLAMLFTVKEWYTHNGNKVFVGKHTQQTDARKLTKIITDMRSLVRSTNNEPSARHMKVLVDSFPT